MTFTATQWNTVEDKGKFVKHFKSFVQKGFPESMFKNPFYVRVSQMNGHIAHYNRGGFFETWFSTSERRADFLKRWAESRGTGDPAWTWSDVERDLAAWLKDNPQYEERERNTHAHLIEHIERAELARLTEKYA
jgi:hypothetical protein